MDDRDSRYQPDETRKHNVIGGIVIPGRGPAESSRVGLVWGALIVAAGVVLLLDHLGFITIGSLFRFWPMILIFFGVGHLFAPSNRVWGLILIVVGAVFQLNNLGFTRIGFGDLWPIAIIAVGLVLIWGALRPSVASKISANLRGSIGSIGPAGLADSTDSTDMFNAIAIFSGCERRVKSQNFKGGRATSIFGGVELDLRDAKIADDQATIEVNCIFGGVEIRVPDNWNVHSTSIPVLGGFSDKTHISSAEDPAGGRRKTLVITGAIVFGGVEIDN
jgi:predicted membrane protein